MRALTALLAACLLLATACSGGDADDPDIADDEAAAVDGDDSGDEVESEDDDAVDDDAADAEPADDGDDASPEATEDDGRAGGAGAGGEQVLVDEVQILDLGYEPQEQAAWTYLVYSMADTNLEEPMLEDIAEVATVGSGQGVNVIALVDREAGHTDQPLLNLDDWQTTKILYVYEDELEELADLGETDMGDPNLLASFVEWGLRIFPADNVALTISDHGGGWTGMGPDDSSGEVMDVVEIESALSAGLNAAGVERIQLLGFDACLMATYEVASTLAPHADYMLASEELEPGHGWDYSSLQVLLEDPFTDAETLGRAFVQGFTSQAEQRGTSAEITLSLVDLGQMGALDAAMTDFAGALVDNVEGLGVVIGRSLAGNISYGRNPDPAQSTQLTDLGQLVSTIGVESLQVSDQADAVLRAINDAVIDQTVGPARLGSTGLSIYFPPVLELTSGAYQGVPQAEAWTQFLIAYYTSGYAIPPEGQPAVAGESRSGGATVVDGQLELGGEAPEAEVVLADAEVVEVEGGVEVSIQLDEAAIPNVTEAYLSFGYIDPEDDAVVLLGDDDAEILADGTVLGFSDLTILTITDAAGDAIDAYLGLEDAGSGLVNATVPLDYMGPGSELLEPVDLRIVADAETGDIQQEVYYLVDEESGSFGELVPEEGARISPVVPVLLDDGTTEWQEFGDTTVAADIPALSYDFEELEAGTEVYLELVVVDYGGNQLIASAVIELL